MEAAARRLLAADCRLLAVVRPGAAKVSALLAGLPHTGVTECPDADLGMGHSLAWGVARSSDASGWLVALADMPFVEPASIHSVAQHLERGASIAVPVCDGRRGHPVGFSRRWRQELLTLSGDRGGVSVVRRNPGCIEFVQCDDPGVLRDVDLPSDLTGYEQD